MKRRQQGHWIWTGLLAGLLATMGMASAHQLTAAEWTDLRAGKVVLTEEGAADLHLDVVAHVLVKRPIETVWQVVSEPKLMFSNESRVKKINILSRPLPKREMVEYTVVLSPLLPKFVYTVQMDYTKPTRVHFKRVSGSFKDFQGECLLTSQGPDETLAAYSMYIDMGPLIPQWFVRQFIRADLPKMIRQVEQQVYAQKQ